MSDRQPPEMAQVAGETGAKKIHRTWDRVLVSAFLGGAYIAFGALVAAFPNTGFMGVPLLVALLGKGAAGPVICSVLADLFVTSSLCIALAQAAGSHDHGQGARAAVLAPVSRAMNSKNRVM